MVLLRLREQMMTLLLVAKGHYYTPLRIALQVKMETLQLKATEQWQQAVACMKPPIDQASEALKPYVTQAVTCMKPPIDQALAALKPPVDQALAAIKPHVDQALTCMKPPFEQAAACMCAPIGSTLAYKGMATSEYPEAETAEAANK